MPYDRWRQLVAERAPNKGDVVKLSWLEHEELSKLRGTRRPPALLFGRKVELPKERAA